jgi:hypothetical protein
VAVVIRHRWILVSFGWLLLVLEVATVLGALLAPRDGGRPGEREAMRVTHIDRSNFGSVNRLRCHRTEAFERSIRGPIRSLRCIIIDSRTATRLASCARP